MFFVYKKDINDNLSIPIGTVVIRSGAIEDLDINCEWTELAHFDPSLDINFAKNYAEGVKQEIRSGNFTPNIYVNNFIFIEE